MQIRLTNLQATSPLAVSARFADKRQIQVTIPAGSYKDVSDVASFEELIRDTKIKDLITRGILRVVPVGETSDPPLMGDIVVGSDNTVDPKYVRVQCAAGGASGAADDVTVFTSLPYDAQIADVEFVCTTAFGASTVTLRTLAGGAGTALSSALATAATGRARDAITTGMPTVTRGTAIFLRRSDRSVVGQLLIKLLPL